MKGEWISQAPWAKALGMSKRTTLRPHRIILGLLLVTIIAGSAFLTGRHYLASRRFDAGQRALEANDFDKARANFLLCREIWTSNPELVLLLAQIARRTGAYEDAAGFLAEAERLGAIPEALDLERDLARVQQADFRPESVLWALVHNGHPQTDLILEALAQGYLGTYRLPQAVDSLDRLIKQRPENARAFFWRGTAWEHLSNRQQALADYRRAAELDPADPKARLDLGKLLIQVAQAQEALFHFEHLFEYQPGNPEVLLGLGQCQVALGHLEKARRFLDMLVERFPNHPQGLIERGNLELMSLRPEKAEVFLRRGVALAPYDRQGTFILAKCLKQLGKDAEAEKWQAQTKRIEEAQDRLDGLMRQMRAAPRDASLRHRAGEIFLEVGFDSEGLQWLASALHEDANHLPTHETLRSYYLRTGRPDLAARHERAPSKKS
jgi:tetratricopeptide (TPR) repeat protein